MKVIDLFAGIGGLSLGFEKAGFELIEAYDNWDYSIEIYNNNFSHKCIKLDLSNVTDFSVFKKADIIIGGPPCQDYSSAGKRDENGGRATLTVEFARIVCEAKPQYFVMENVIKWKVELDTVHELAVKLIDGKAKSKENDANFDKTYSEYQARHETARTKIESLQKEKQLRIAKKTKMETYLKYVIDHPDHLLEWNESTWRLMVESAEPVVWRNVRTLTTGSTPKYGSIIVSEKVLDTSIYNPYENDPSAYTADTTLGEKMNELYETMLPSSRTTHLTTSNLQNDIESSCQTYLFPLKESSFTGNSTSFADGTLAKAAVATDYARSRAYAKNDITSTGLMSYWTRTKYNGYFEVVTTSGTITITAGDSNVDRWNSMGVRPSIKIKWSN